MHRRTLCLFSLTVSIESEGHRWRDWSHRGTEGRGGGGPGRGADAAGLTCRSLAADSTQDGRSTWREIIRVKHGGTEEAGRGLAKRRKKARTERRLRCQQLQGANCGKVLFMAMCHLWQCAICSKVLFVTRCQLWQGAIYGNVQIVVRCYLWQCANYGKVLFVARCQLWQDATYGHQNLLPKLSTV